MSQVPHCFNLRRHLSAVGISAYAVAGGTFTIHGDATIGWLIQVAQACLLKDWRPRLQLVTWDSFKYPPTEMDSSHQERGIRLRQIRREEMRLVAEKKTTVAPAPTREQELWNLNAALFLEIRTYLMDTPIFPKFRVNEITDSGRAYTSTYDFEQDRVKGFEAELSVRIVMRIAQDLELATAMSFEAIYQTELIQEAAWTEMFTVESAFRLCRKALLDTVELLIPKE